jgi:hypothetical protein
MKIVGDHQLIENNAATRTADVATSFSTHTVFRGNTMHDITTADCGSHSSNCHIDFIESEPTVATTPPTAFNLWEGNVQINNLGHDAHSYLTQADACNGQCSHVIERFNLTAHEGSAAGSYSRARSLGGVVRRQRFDAGIRRELEQRRWDLPL